MNPNPGRTETFHRLNRVEYANTIRDVLGLEGIDFSVLLPSDDASYGFDNIAGITKMSPALLERYAVAARKISRWAVGDPTIPPSSETYRVPLDLTQEYRLDDSAFGTRGGLHVRRHFSADGSYAIKFGIAYAIGAASSESNALEVAVDGELRETLTISPPGPRQLARERDTDRFQVEVPITAGFHDVSLTFAVESSAEVEELLQPFLRAPAVSLFGLTRAGSYNGHYLSWVSIVGPYDVVGVSETASRQRIFGCHPTDGVDESICAREILSRLARRVYRRPVTETDLATLLDFYEAGRERRGFEGGIQQALERMLASPEFLFRIVRDPDALAPNSPYPLNDIELASRMSFFLWSSGPDDELLELAEQGRLSSPEILGQQVDRMLEDPRSSALVENFAGQWLRLRNLPAAAPDQRAFPDFDENLRQAFRKETELFFESISHEGRSVLDLLSADYTFVNERLARHYDIPHVYGSRFRRVELPEGQRGGLLTHGSILTVTSYSTRTSPVNRGKWVLENVLGTPPPAPPPDVPALEVQLEGDRALTMREAMARHRANPVCASCHRVMDPLGFGLENFDAVGSWRHLGEDGLAIDASGTLPDGSRFDGVAGLRDALIAAPHTFISVVVEKLLTYALGRGVEYYDYPTIRSIIRNSEHDGYKLTTILHEIVTSVPFRMRRTAPLEEPEPSSILAR